MNKETVEFIEKLSYIKAGILKSNNNFQHEERKIKSFELIFVKQGELPLYQADKQVNIKENECLIVHPGIQHGGLASTHGPLQFFWIHFQLNSRKKSRFTELFPIGKIYGVKRPEHLTVVIHRLLSEQESQELNSLSANALMRLIFNEILFQETHQSLDQNTEMLALKCFYLIKSNSKSLTSKNIASRLGYNPDYLERVFKKKFQVTITQKIHEQKIIKSIKLLTENQLNIEQISEECGFKDANYFRRIFKKFHGVTPKKFKNMHTKIHVIRN